MLTYDSKRAQEEIVGFALIIIIVAVIFLIFLSFAIKDKDEVGIESYKVENFLHATLQYTSDCRNNLEYLSIQKLISSCDKGEECVNLNNKDACEVLSTTLTEIVEKSWDVEPGSPIKGYELNITSEGGTEIFSLEEGNSTVNYKIPSQHIPRSRTSYDISFKVYY